MALEVSIAHKKITCAGFTGIYSSTNGIKSIGATRLSLARSLIALGPSHHRMSPLTGAFWWSLRGVVTIFSLLTADLRPTVGFMRLTASHRASDAFKLGETLTRWFALNHLNSVVFAPLENWTGTLGAPDPKFTYPPKAMPKHFRHSVKVGKKSEPDFIAITSDGLYHVIESKGRANFGTNGVTQNVVNSARNKALRQVCQIATVNGVAPETRTACVFAFDQSGTFGQVTDPPSSETYDYQISVLRLIHQSYAVVLDPLFQRFVTEIDVDYLGIEFMPGWKFGIHKAIYRKLQSIKDENGAIEFLLTLRDPPFEANEVSDPNRRSDRSIGRDGLILMGNPDLVKGRMPDLFG
ncbi:hypothetical protein [Devosia sp. MC521]|uniref:hypothetical protein n=1 Tax=Devosia sp. MC521 TaxID=2759954 RepID=UPI0015FC41E2|nr:hypothetical protein [Devosia sp. MC521]MBJ6988204.1 hypothetical protein [Devosia sp. MC521]QMW63279.1 hypothetical protein H4N61_02740 [Devosia sp. MC521]